MTAQDDIADDVHTVVASRQCKKKKGDRVTRKESVVLNTPVANKVGLVLGDRGKVIFKRQSTTRVFRSIVGAKGSLQSAHVHIILKDRVALEGRMFLAAACTPAPVASECSIAQKVLASASCSITAAVLALAWRFRCAMKMA